MSGHRGHTRTFRPGDRVTLSDYGRAQLPKGYERGVIKARAREPDCWRVQFDSPRERMTFHEKLLAHEQGRYERKLMEAVASTRNTSKGQPK